MHSNNALLEKLTLLAETCIQRENQMEETLTAQEITIEEVPVESGKIWRVVKTMSSSSFLSLTGFSVAFINELIVDTVEISPVLRGPKPIYTLEDGIFCLLMCLHQGVGSSQICSQLNLKSEQSLRVAINKARPLVHSVLLRRQESFRRIRPQVSVAPRGVQANKYLGLASDCTPILIHKPKISFNAAKEYYDAHHDVYALKVEVAVSVTPPHYALFWSKLQPGAIADFTITKGRQAIPPTVEQIPSAAAQYTNYLKATASEIHLFLPPSSSSSTSSSQSISQSPQASSSSSSPPEKYWALIQDSGFRGVLPVPYPRIITKPLSPNNPTPPDQLFYKNKRVVVEQFFGRLKKVFKILSGPYPFDKATIQTDVEIWIMLTNCHIQVNVLSEADGDRYKQWLSLIKSKEESKKRKQVVATQKWRANRRAKLEAETQEFDGDSQAESSLEDPTLYQVFDDQENDEMDE